MCINYVYDILGTYIYNISSATLGIHVITQRVKLWISILNALSTTYIGFKMVRDKVCWNKDLFQGQSIHARVKYESCIWDIYL